MQRKVLKNFHMYFGADKSIHNNNINVNIFLISLKTK